MKKFQGSNWLEDWLEAFAVALVLVVVFAFVFLGFIFVNVISLFFSIESVKFGDFYVFK